MNILRISGRTAGPAPRFALSVAATLALAPALDADCAVVSPYSNSTSMSALTPLYEENVLWAVSDLAIRRDPVDWTVDGKKVLLPRFSPGGKP